MADTGNVPVYLDRNGRPLTGAARAAAERRAAEAAPVDLPEVEAVAELVAEYMEAHDPERGGVDARLSVYARIEASGRAPEVHAGIELCVGACR